MMLIVMHDLRFRSRTKVLFGFLSVIFMGLSTAWALDVTDTNFSPQSATGSGSSNSVIWFSTGAASTGTTSYINKGNDSDTVGNYFHGYYFDTQLGFFRLDWNQIDTDKNVRVVSSTDKCGTGYGYKFAGYAYSDTAGLIRFDYSNDIFVYYCESDKRLHWYAYSDHVGFQNFEGLSFEIIAFTQNVPILTSWSDPFFVNNNSLILMGSSNNAMDIQWESVVTNKGSEAIFYIVK